MTGHTVAVIPGRVATVLEVRSVPRPWSEWCVMKLVVQELLTLGGVSQGPGSPDEDNGDGFTRGGRLVPYLDVEFDRLAGAWLGEAGAFLFGRRTCRKRTGRGRCPACVAVRHQQDVKIAVLRQCGVKLAWASIGMAETGGGSDARARQRAPVPEPSGRIRGEGMARVGVAAVQLLPSSGEPGHAHRRRRGPGTASSSPYEPGSRRIRG
ncbi:hypothetical protein FM21_01285 [Streptomyces mutabilis]|uniref:Uncharacterized protein n=1 Tax=Streptomyces mutabilis TaxID=67332 RepID=A0A086N108_9ACTN|nr:hypothetical protein FM21_01285 [Streptomyces mutabilis]